MGIHEREEQQAQRPRRGAQPEADALQGERVPRPEHDLRPASLDASAALLAAVASRQPLHLGPAARQLQRRYGNRHVARAVQRARQGRGAFEVEPEVEEAIQRARGGGQALDGTARIQMEGALGADFSAVRIHTGAEADALNRALEARAFTTGSDIFFRDGEYSPGSSAGRELLAHELTHVVQQGGGVRPKLVVGGADDEYEREAERIALSATTVNGQRQSSDMLYCDEKNSPLKDQVLQRDPESSFRERSLRGVKRSALIWEIELWDQSWIKECLGSIRVVADYIFDGQGNIRIYHVEHLNTRPINRWLRVGVDITSRSLNIFEDNKEGGLEEAEIWIKITVAGPQTSIQTTTGVSANLSLELTSGFEQGDSSRSTKAALAAGVNWSRSVTQNAGGAVGTIARGFRISTRGTEEKSEFHVDLADLVIDDEEGPENDSMWQNDWHVSGINERLR